MAMRVTWKDIEEAVTATGSDISEANDIKRACMSRGNRINEAVLRACLEGITDSDPNQRQFHGDTLEGVGISKGVQVLLLQRIKHKSRSEFTKEEEPEIIEIIDDDDESSSRSVKQEGFIKQEDGIKQEDIKRESQYKQEQENEIELQAVEADEENVIWNGVHIVNPPYKLDVTAAADGKCDASNDAESRNANSRPNAAQVINRRKPSRNGCFRAHDDRGARTDVDHAGKRRRKEKRPSYECVGGGGDIDTGPEFEYLDVIGTNRMAEETEEGQIGCPSMSCGKLFKNRKYLISHRTRVHHRCNKCDKDHQTEEELRKHWMRERCRAPCRFEPCDRFFGVAASCKKHEEVCNYRPRQGEHNEGAEAAEAQRVLKQMKDHEFKAPKEHLQTSVTSAPPAQPKTEKGKKENAMRENKVAQWTRTRTCQKCQIMFNTPLERREHVRAVHGAGQKRAVSKSSPVWKHFVEIEGTEGAKCALCHATINAMGSNTSAMWHHLAGRHQIKPPQRKRKSPLWAFARERGQQIDCMLCEAIVWKAASQTKETAAMRAHFQKKHADKPEVKLALDTTTKPRSQAALVRNLQ